MIYEEEIKELGTIVFLNDEKGFGFIQIEGREKNVFFHAKDVRHIAFEKLRKGDSVEVEGIKQTEKGFNSGKVYLVS